MNCTICGKSTLPGAMLCAPCKAALKRARYVTVQEDMRRPSVIDVRRQARRVPGATRTTVPEPIPATEVEPPVPFPGDAIANARLARRIFLGVFVLAAVLGSASYFGQRELSARSHENAPASAATAEPATEAAPVTNAATSAVAPSQVPARSPAIADTPAPLPPVGNSLVAAASNPHAATHAAASTGKRTLAKDSTSFATANGDPPDAVPMPEPAKPQAAAPPPPPPPAPDRWQSMRDAIAQCDREGFLDGIICGQKARIQYCAGYWGKVPQCPGPTVNPEH